MLFEPIVSNSNTFSRSTRFGVESVADIPLAPNRFASLGVIHIEDLRSSEHDRTTPCGWING
ncbi:MAG: hypothetical protein LBG15_14500 [Dysgonamonadaceae bacterium]|nr:hypothetical protein [Dysgonamonadaceae bacterium]